MTGRERLGETERKTKSEESENFGEEGETKNWEKREREREREREIWEGDKEHWAEEKNGETGKSRKK